jgi:hypothetical protein
LAAAPVGCWVPGVVGGGGGVGAGAGVGSGGGGGVALGSVAGGVCWVGSVGVVVVGVVDDGSVPVVPGSAANTKAGCKVMASDKTRPILK